MLFHTHEFFVLLALTAIGFAWLRSARQSVLLAASIAFYAYAGLGMALLFAAVVGFNFLVYRKVRDGANRRLLGLAIAVDLANLFAFKYTLLFLEVLGFGGLQFAAAESWVIQHVVLPVGISFYTFQMIAVLVDAHRGTAPPVGSFREFALFVSFFGQLIAGPIMRGVEFLPQLKRLPGPSPDQLAQGIAWFTVGLVKKVFFADWLLAPEVDALFQDPAGWGIATSWLLGLLFGFQIYFDFSGYCDMAVGLGKFFGLELRINFATPYTSRSPSEFWNRWNITLSRWFGEYVYIPLGGSRVPLPRTVVNLLITMLASGLWHGAGFTFVVWGGIHGVAQALFHTWKKLRPDLAARMETSAITRTTLPFAALGWTFTFATAVIGWVYFRADSIASANTAVSHMFRASGERPEADLAWLVPLCAALLALHFIERAWWQHHENLVVRGQAAWMRLPGPAQAVLVFPVLLALVGATKKVQGAFIYFQF